MCVALHCNTTAKQRRWRQGPDSALTPSHFMAALHGEQRVRAHATAEAMLNMLSSA